jgi:23S rRNA A2030 N6-methylase RlmJ
MVILIVGQMAAPQIDSGFVRKHPVPPLVYRKMQMLYDISRVALEHEIRDEERTVEVLLNVCENNQDQYKRIIEAIEEDGNDSKRARIYANDGLIYNETCIRKYTKQLSNSSMPEPLALSPKVQASSSNKPTHKSPLRIIDPNPRKTDMEWVKEFVEEYRTTKKENELENVL